MLSQQLRRSRVNVHFVLGKPAVNVLVEVYGQFLRLLNFFLVNSFVYLEGFVVLVPMRPRLKYSILFLINIRQKLVQAAHLAFFKAFSLDFVTHLFLLLPFLDLLMIFLNKLILRNTPLLI